MKRRRAIVDLTSDDDDDGPPPPPQRMFIPLPPPNQFQVLFEGGRWERALGLARFFPQNGEKIYIQGDALYARVQGRERPYYTVTINKNLRNSCTCPDGPYCKHIGAVMIHYALNWREIDRNARKGWTQILDEMGRSQLQDMLIEIFNENPVISSRYYRNYVDSEDDEDDDDDDDEDDDDEDDSDE
eukprot:TRINITY_DN1415_c0_g1_i1.p1 TRINITY_DN1415_c0_g1~~TRINITY_DN1415_c0_g1_i1.p1  ORF type:complete len:202 (-),score=41.50 TRINITY_DN1415_c0_g1_i1:111-668(-)